MLSIINLLAMTEYLNENLENKESPALMSSTACFSRTHFSRALAFWVTMTMMLMVWLVLLMSGIGFGNHQYYYTYWNGSQNDEFVICSRETSYYG
jgi:hypothetical protein